MKPCGINVPKRHENKKSTSEMKKKKLLKAASLGDHELIVCEILSRLPAKSLMRFKCVCKSWQSLIQKDQHFIDLHFNRSLTRSCNGTAGGTSLLIRVPSMWNFDDKTSKWCLLCAELLIPAESNDGGGAAVQRKIPLNVYGVSMLNIVNGLICLIKWDTHSVRVFNPSTRESTPCIKSLVMQGQEEEKEENNKYHNFDWDTFGYDVATKDYKVVSFWSRLVAGPNKKKIVCEIYSLRHKSCRLIDAVPPVDPIILHLSDSVYANGSIYWLRADGAPLVVGFDFGTEKFRVISVPNSIAISSYGHYKTSVTELDGRLALLAKERVDAVMSTSSKMCILHEDQDETNKSTIGYTWIEESFAMPPRFDWREKLADVIPVPGTDLFIVRSNDDKFSFYYYNWKNKSYSRKFELNGSESYNIVKTDYVGLYTFTENLLPLN